MTRGVFKITDGTYQVDLLKLREGVSAQDWRQAVASYKDSGVWQQSSLSDGRRLVDKKFTNAQESIHIPAIGGDGRSQNVTISILHRLFALTQKASDYWVSNWQDEPVWLEVRAECETNSRYAVVSTANIPAIADIFQPGAFANNAALTDMTLIIERDHWTENEPGTGTAVELGTVEAYNSRSVGNVDDSGVADPTTAIDEVFVYNGAKTSNLTHIYWQNITLGTWSANLMDAALPFALTPALAVGETGRIFFGVNSALANSGPFTSLVFDIGTASVNLGGGGLEYYNSVAGWAPLSATGQDYITLAGTGVFGETGILSAHFLTTPVAFGVDTWGTANLLGLYGGVAPNVTAYWAYMSLLNTSGLAAVTPPQQQNRDIYTVSWPYTDLQSNQALGNIPSLERLVIRAETGEGNQIFTNAEFGALTGRLFISNRSISRGSLFSAYINAADEQNPTGLTLVVVSGAYVDTALVPTGRAIEYTSGGAGLVESWTIAFDPALIDEYIGKFRLFVRARTSDATPEDSSIQVKGTIRTTAGATTTDVVLWETDEVGFSATIVPERSLFELVDLGEITLPAPVKTLLPAETGGTFKIALYANASVAETITFMDIILMPVDEWAIETTEYRNRTVSGKKVLYLFKGRLDYSVNRYTRYFDIDGGLIVPKEYVRSNLKFSADDSFLANWLSVKNSRLGITPGQAQRMWFLASAEGDDGIWVSSCDPAFTISVSRNAQYLGPRGDV